MTMNSSASTNAIHWCRVLQVIRDHATFSSGIVRSYPGVVLTGVTLSGLLSARLFQGTWEGAQQLMPQQCSGCGFVCINRCVSQTSTSHRRRLQQPDSDWSGPWQEGHEPSPVVLYTPVINMQLRPGGVARNGADSFALHQPCMHASYSSPLQRAVGSRTGLLEPIAASRPPSVYTHRKLG